VDVSQAAWVDDHPRRSGRAADGVRQSAGRPAAADLIGRLDLNTEGLLLLTNDGGLARGAGTARHRWLARYRVRAHGEVTQAQLDELKKGVEVDGRQIWFDRRTLERDHGANVWLVFAIREGKKPAKSARHGASGLEVNRLIRVSYGPFSSANSPRARSRSKTRVLRGNSAKRSQPWPAPIQPADAGRSQPEPPMTRRGQEKAVQAGRKKRLIADRKGRRILVQRHRQRTKPAPQREEATATAATAAPARLSRQARFEAAGRVRDAAMGLPISGVRELSFTSPLGRGRIAQRSGVRVTAYR